MNFVRLTTSPVNSSLICLFLVGGRIWAESAGEGKSSTFDKNPKAYASGKGPMIKME
jgi:hypothetical protein